jgi:hypothetical protein
LKFLDVTLKPREEEEQEYVKPAYDWRYENSIMSTKNYIDIEGVVEFKYDPFRTNRALSNYRDTIAAADEMNRNYHLSHKMQYDYLFHSVRKSKRWFKRKKKEKDSDFLLVQSYYKYNNEKTKQALRVLTKEQIAIIRKEKEKGG